MNCNSTFHIRLLCLAADVGYISVKAIIVLPHVVNSTEFVRVPPYLVSAVDSKLFSIT